MISLVLRVYDLQCGVGLRVAVCCGEGLGLAVWRGWLGVGLVVR